MNNKRPTDKFGKPLNGINTSRRASNLGGNNKRKKSNILKAEQDYCMKREEKESALLEKKQAAEAKLAAKKKAREEARLLDIQLGFITIDEPAQEEAEPVQEQVVMMAWGSYLARGVGRP